MFTTFHKHGHLITVDVDMTLHAYHLPANMHRRDYIAVIVDDDFDPIIELVPREQHVDIDRVIDRLIDLAETYAESK